MTRPDVPVLLVVDRLGELGGVQRVVTDVSRGLLARGCDVRVLQLEPGEHPVPYDVLTARPGSRSRLPYEPTDAWRRAKLLARGPVVWLDLARRQVAVRRLARLLHDVARAGRTPGVVVVATQLRSAEQVVAARRVLARHAPDEARCVHVVAQYHGSFAAARDGDDLGRVVRLSGALSGLWVLNAGDGAGFATALGTELAVEPTVERATRRAPGPRVVPNPVDVAGLGGAAGPPDSRERLVVAGGRLDADKGFDLLVRAWAGAGARLDGWRCEIHGDGPERDRLTGLVESLGLAGRVQVLPASERFRAALGRAALCVLPSRHEGMGLVLAEALASGVPCVATDAGPGVRELVVDGVTGLLVPRDDVGAIAHAIATLVADPVRRARMAGAGREHVARFDTGRVLDVWQAALADVGGDVARAVVGRTEAQGRQEDPKGRPV